MTGGASAASVPQQSTAIRLVHHNADCDVLVSWSARPPHPRPTGPVVWGTVTEHSLGTTMIVAFETETLRLMCEDPTVAVQKLGAPTAQALRERLSDVRAASSPADLFVGSPRFEGAKEEQLIIDLTPGIESVWEANHLRSRQTGDGLTDWTQVSRVRLISIGGAKHAR